MKKSWWKVPAYCMIASWIGFDLEVRLLARFAIVKLPDGTVTSDSLRSMIVSGGLFAAIVLIGGLLFFRKMTRRELTCSATVLVALNFILGLIAYKTQGMPAFYWAKLSEWDVFVSSLLYRLGLGIWGSAVITWVLPPYVFVLFGRKE